MGIIVTLKMGLLSLFNSMIYFGENEFQEREDDSFVCDVVILLTTFSLIYYCFEQKG